MSIGRAATGQRRCGASFQNQTPNANRGILFFIDDPCIQQVLRQPCDKP